MERSGPVAQPRGLIARTRASSTHWRRQARFTRNQRVAPIHPDRGPGRRRMPGQPGHFGNRKPSRRPAHPRRPRRPIRRIRTLLLTHQARHDLNQPRLRPSGVVARRVHPSNANARLQRQRHHQQDRQPTHRRAQRRPDGTLAIACPARILGLGHQALVLNPQTGSDRSSLSANSSAAPPSSPNPTLPRARLAPSPRVFWRPAP